MSAAQRLICELPNQSTAPGLPAVPSTELIRPLSLLYMSCQMIPTSARDSMTGMKKALWYIHEPRRLKDFNLRGSWIYQSAFFIPVMLSLALVGIIWQLMYSSDSGLINSVLGTAGKPGAVDWFGNSQINLWAALVATSWRHVGYIMILYLAGLKGVDPTLKEAAAVDGASATQTFFRVVFPAMKPINIVVVVITVIEALRAFDIVYIINRGTNGLELIGALVVQNLVGEGQVIGIGSALAVMLLVVSLVPITIYLSRVFG